MPSRFHPQPPPLTHQGTLWPRRPIGSHAPPFASPSIVVYMWLYSVYVFGGGTNSNTDTTNSPSLFCALYVAPSRSRPRTQHLRLLLRDISVWCLYTHEAFSLSPVCVRVRVCICGGGVGAPFKLRSLCVASHLLAENPKRHAHRGEKTSSPSCRPLLSSASSHSLSPSPSLCLSPLGSLALGLWLCGSDFSHILVLAAIGRPSSRASRFERKKKRWQPIHQNRDIMILWCSKGLN